MKKYVVITGASTGIGYGCVAELIKHDYHVFGSVRKEADAQRLQQDFGENYTPLLFDVTDSVAIHAAAQQVTELIGDEATLCGLVNNAGIAVPGPILHLPLDEFRHQFEVNLFGLIDVTQAFLPLLGTRKNIAHPPGRIVNISSINGTLANPFLSPYVASKHALEGFSKSLRQELMLYGIEVVVVAPGVVQTPIWDKADEVEITPYLETDYATALQKMKRMLTGISKRGMSADRISHTVRTALESQRPKTLYRLPGNWLLSWILPYWDSKERVHRKLDSLVGPFYNGKVCQKILNRNFLNINIK